MLPFLAAAAGFAAAGFGGAAGVCACAPIANNAPAAKAVKVIRPGMGTLIAFSIE